MTLCSRSTTIVAFIICIALPASAQQYLLYTPQPAPSGLDTTPQDGILVQEIEIRKGDTLHGLSRKFSGHGMYFPQILLFNSIKNPNLIYVGDSLKIPVGQKRMPDSEYIEATSARSAAKPVKTVGKKASLKNGARSVVKKPAVSAPISTPTAELSLNDLKMTETKTNKTSGNNKKTVDGKKKNPSVVSPARTNPATKLPAAHKNSAGPAAASGQLLFERAMKAYKQGDCRTTLELLDRFLADNSGSPLAADANLYKADCYLKLSAQ